MLLVNETSFILYFGLYVISKVMTNTTEFTIATYI